MPLERVIGYLEYLWWAPRYLDVDGVIVTLKKAMYEDTTIRVKVNGREDFIVRVGAHQGPVLSPLLFVLFVIVLEALRNQKRLVHGTT